MDYKYNCSSLYYLNMENANIMWQCFRCYFVGIRKEANMACKGKKKGCR